MKLIEADKVERAIKDYWKAQVDKLPIPKSIEEHDERVNRLDAILEHNDGLLKEIEALPSAEPDTTTHDSIPAKTGKNDGDGTSDDCISRTQAIDMIKEIYEWHDSVTKERIIEHFKQLPSAQPDIIRCKDCKYYKYGICMKIGANKSFYGFCDWAERGEQNGRLNQQDAGG